MDKSKINAIVKNTSMALSKHAPGILTGFGIAGMFTTTILAVKATPKALKLIEQKKKAEGVKQLTPLETIKTTWKCYIPAGSIAIASTACLIGASSISGRRNAVLATAYEIAKTAHHEYREKVIETIGEKKEELIRDKVAKEQIEKNPVSNNTVILTDSGNTLCYDTLSGRYFRTDIDKIKRIENELNRQMVHDMYISLNDFYSALGLECVYPLGEDLGWKCDNGLITLDFSSQLNERDEPCLVINYSIAPKHNYYKL